MLVFITAILIFANRKALIKDYSYLNNPIDLTKMLQYGDQMGNVKVTDRYGRFFDLDAFHNQPVLLFFIKYNLPNIKALDDSLHKYLKLYFDNGLNIVYVKAGNFCEKRDSPSARGLNVYCDTDSMDLFKAFKVYNHNACIILDKEHRDILATTKMITLVELEKILRYKEPVFF